VIRVNPNRARSKNALALDVRNSRAENSESKSHYLVGLRLFGRNVSRSSVVPGSPLVRDRQHNDSSARSGQRAVVRRAVGPRTLAGLTKLAKIMAKTCICATREGIWSRRVRIDPQAVGSLWR
jgi:hypothetical protein